MDGSGVVNLNNGTEDNNWEPFREKVWATALAVAKLDPQSQAIPVHKFCASYLSSVGGTHTEVDQICLSVIFSDHGEEEEEFPLVSKKQFDLFLRRFGPPERSLAKIRDVLQNGKKWFHGKQSRQASERLLMESGREGDFLMRYSSVEGAFTVDYIKRQKICHFNNIRNDAGGGVCVLVGKTPEQQKAYKFTSMSAFITKNEHIFVNPCLNPRSHFQWLKLRIPDNPSERGAEAKADVDEDEEDSSDDEHEDPSQSKVPLEERIKNAIQNSFQKHKTTLSLKNLGMGPTLPLHICRLNYVVYLDLSRNKLTELPEDLSALRLLKRLNVSANKLTSLPGSIFASFPRLHSLIGAENQITEIPEGLFKATTLSYLDLSSNKISKVPAAVNELAQLGFLELSNNQIDAVPALDKLEKLEELYVNDNQLREISGSLASLPALMHLDISSNQVTHIPKEILSLVSDNNAFCIVVDNNPLVEEDKSKLLALLQANKNRDRAESRTKGSRDILGVIRVNSEKLQDVATKSRSRAMPSEGSATLRPHKDKERGGGDDDGDGEGRSQGKSMWTNGFGFKIEEGRGPRPQSKDLHLQEHINVFDYRRYFYHQTVHANIIGNDKQLGQICISIQKEPTMSTMVNLGEQPYPVYRVLLRTKQNDRRLEIRAAEVKIRKKEKYARSDDLMDALKKLLQPFSPRHLWVIRDKRSHREFALLEDKLKSNCSKFGVIYGRDGQDETQMYNNEHGSEVFEDFLSSLGDRINMKGWDKYRGDFSNKADQKSLYTVFGDHEIMFHVMTYILMMKNTDQYGQQWERKRFIGNDIVVIVFYEGKKPLDPNIFVSNFNHVFALVVPEERNGTTYYALHMAYKVGVAESKPPLPEEAVWERGPEFREFLLTKLINAERCAMSATQFRRPQEKVRAELFENLQTKFPKKSARGIARSKATDDGSQISPEYLDKETADAIAQIRG